SCVFEPAWRRPRLHSPSAVSAALPQYAAPWQEPLLAGWFRVARGNARVDRHGRADGARPNTGRGIAQPSHRGRAHRAATPRLRAHARPVLEGDRASEVSTCTRKRHWPQQERILVRPTRHGPEISSGPWSFLGVAAPSLGELSALVRPAVAGLRRAGRR